MRCERPLARVIAAVAAVATLGGALGACDPAPAPDDPLYVPVAVPGCEPSLDGVISADELPFVVGATARVRVGRDVPVSTEGEPGPAGTRVWDLSRPDPDDEPVGLLTLEDMAGQWFASSFPDADVAGPLEPGNALLGPLMLDDDGVKLLGTASRDPADAAGKTLLAYSAPVTLYPLPLEPGATREVTAEVTNGLAFGVPVALIDSYRVEVSGRGRVILPDLIFEDALRVTLRLERVPVAGIAVQQVTHVFLNECVGEVARMASPFVPLDAELPDAFPVAAEVRRLAL